MPRSKTQVGISQEEIQQVVVVIKKLDKHWAANIAFEMQKDDDTIKEKNVYDIFANKIKNQNIRRLFVAAAKRHHDTLKGEDDKAYSYLSSILNAK